MGIKALKGKSIELLKKYRYVGIVLLIGIILMGLPSKKKTQNTPTDQNVSYQADAASYQEELTQILESINGVGEVRVLLTTETGTESVYQSDHDTTQSQNDQTNSKKTVIISGADRQESGLLRYQTSPRYRGAVIVCQGGDQPSVQLAVTSAVARATGLRADQICVLKMK